MSFLKTFTAPVFKTSFKLWESVHSYIIQWTNPGQNTTLTIPDPGGATDTFVLLNATQTLTNKSIAAGQLTGQVGIANGGTGQSTASAGFNALSPITSTGDLIVGNGTNSATRLGIGSSGTALISSGGTAVWGTPTVTAGTLQGVVAVAGNYTASTSHIILCNCSTGPLTVILPPASSSLDYIYCIKKTDSTANIATIAGNYTDTVDGASTEIIDLQYDSFTVVSDGGSWWNI